MKWLNPTTGKTYGTVLEALVDYMCPGPCIECPMNHPWQRTNTHDTVPMTPIQPCLKYVKDNPLQAAQMMGLTQVETVVNDMTLGEVQWICNARACEFGADMCVGCVLWGEREEGLPVGCKLMNRGWPPSDWQLDTFITFDTDERLKLRGLRDAFGEAAIIERTADKALILSTPDAKVELPQKWWKALPNNTSFTMVDAVKNDFVGVLVKATGRSNREVSKRMPAPPLKPDAGKVGEHTDERGMLDPQSYNKQGG